MEHGGSRGGAAIVTSKGSYDAKHFWLDDAGADLKVVMFPMMSDAAPFVAESTAVDAGHGIDEKLISLSPRCGHQMAATAEHSRSFVIARSEHTALRMVFRGVTPVSRA
jgi:hypothetical protein